MTQVTLSQGFFISSSTKGPCANRLRRPKRWGIDSESAASDFCSIAFHHVSPMKDGDSIIRHWDSNMDLDPRLFGGWNSGRMVNELAVHPARWWFNQHQLGVWLNFTRQDCDLTNKDLWMGYSGLNPQKRIHMINTIVFVDVCVLRGNKGSLR